MKKNRIFREELPGEKKSIISLLLTGYIAVISILGYTAFYMNIQLGQIERLLPTLERNILDPVQFTILKTTFQKSVIKLQNEIIWIAIFGSLFSIIGGFYTYSMIVRPLRQLVSHMEEGKGEPPEIKSNNEIKQLMTAIDSVNGNTNLTQPNPETKKMA